LFVAVCGDGSTMAAARTVKRGIVAVPATAKRTTGHEFTHVLPAK
jgi:hypothetical protein